MKKYVIGIDFGTLSGRSVLVDLETGQKLLPVSWNIPMASWISVCPAV